MLGRQYYTVITDPFSGTDTLKDFTLTSPPQNIQSITIGGVLYAPTSSNKVGVVGQDTNGVNGYVVLYDKNSSVIHFYTAPSAGTNNILITYLSYIELRGGKDAMNTATIVVLFIFAIFAALFMLIFVGDRIQQILEVIQSIFRYIVIFLVLALVLTANQRRRNGPMLAICRSSMSM